MTKMKEVLKADARYKVATQKLEGLKAIEDPEKRAEEIQEASRLIVATAYDRAEVYELLGFTLLESADILFRESAKILQAVNGNVKFNDRFKINESLRALNKMIKNFEIESEKIHADYHLHGEVEDSDLTPYDAIRSNSKVILKVLMLVYNALKKSKGNAAILERSLRKLKGVGEDIFTIEEINSM